MQNMFNVPTILPHNRLQTNPCIRHNFSSKFFKKRADNFTIWSLSCATCSGTLWNTLSLKHPHKRPLFQLPIMQTVSSFSCILPSVYAKVHKTIQLSPFDLQSTARCPPFYKLVTSNAFSMNYSIHTAYRTIFKISTMNRVMTEKD
jgi:hypothetical protein